MVDCRFEFACYYREEGKNKILVHESDIFLNVLVLHGLLQSYESSNQLVQVQVQGAVQVLVLPTSTSLSTGSYSLENTEVMVTTVLITRYLYSIAKRECDR
jgi:hypothetical protein